MVLTVQFREDASEAHEQDCVRRHMPKGEEAKFISIFDKSQPWDDPAALLKGVRRLVLGGSGAISLGRGHEGNDYDKADYIVRVIEPLVRYVLEEDFPTLGACFGHQLLGHFMGEPVVFDPAMAETGFLEVETTEAGREDRLFAGITERFAAVLGHQDSLVHVPRGAVQLAFTAACPTQCLRFGKNVYGTQFHSEMDAEDLAFRVKLFPQYAAHAKSLKPVPMPYSVKVLENFLA